MGNLDLKFKLENLTDGSSVAVVDMKGSIDGSTVKKFESETLALAQKGFKYLILNFSEIGYMNSTGLGILVKVLDRYQEQGGDMKLVQVPKKVSDLFDMLGISSILSIYATMEAAFNALPAKLVAKSEAAVPTAPTPTPAKGKLPPAPVQVPTSASRAVSTPAAVKPVPAPPAPAPLVNKPPVMSAPKKNDDDDMGGGILIDADEDQPVVETPAPPRSGFAPAPAKSSFAPASGQPSFASAVEEPMPESFDITGDEESPLETLDLSAPDQTELAQQQQEASFETGIDLSSSMDEPAKEEKAEEMAAESEIETGFDFGASPEAAQEQSATATPETMDEISEELNDQDGLAAFAAPKDEVAADTGLENAMPPMEELQLEELDMSAEVKSAPVAEAPLGGLGESGLGVGGSLGGELQLEAEKSADAGLAPQAAEIPMDEIGMDELDDATAKNKAADESDKKKLAEAMTGEPEASPASDKEQQDVLSELSGLDDIATKLATTESRPEPDGERRVATEVAGPGDIPVFTHESAAAVGMSRSSSSTATSAPVSEPALRAEIQDAKPEKPVVAQESLKRKTTVRYYEQMNPFTAYPLCVTLSKEAIKKVQLEKVAQTQSAKSIEVTKAKPDVTIVPCLSGCLITPASITIDVTPETAVAEFWVTPVVEGEVPGWVDIIYQGKLVDKIPLKTKSVKQTLAKIGAAGALLSPIASYILDGVQFNVAKSFGELVQKVHGHVGLLVAGGISMALFVIAGSLFYLRNRPREAEIIEKFFSVEPVKK